MAYSKMTVADFKKKLGDGHYANPTGARRGAGKADLDDADKAKCYRAINKHFNVEDEPTAAKSDGKKKAGVAKVAKKLAQVVKLGLTATPKRVIEPIAVPAGKKAAAPAKKRLAKVADVDVDALAQLHLAAERIGTISQAIAAMKAAKEAYPDLDTRTGATAAGAALTDIVHGLHNAVKGEQLTLGAIDPTVMHTLAKTAVAAHGLPGHESPVRMPGNSMSIETPV